MIRNIEGKFLLKTYVRTYKVKGAISVMIPPHSVKPQQRRELSAY